MEGGRTDITGDEEVETRNEEPTAGAAIDPGVGNLVWDPQDLLFEFNNENLGATQTPVAALTPVVAQIEDEMQELVDASPEESPQVSLPRSPGTSTSPVMPIRRFTPDYSDVPLVRFSPPELYQVVPWIHFEAQNMCEPLWCTELALIRKDEMVRYMAAMFTWFCCWWSVRGSWP